MTDMMFFPDFCRYLISKVDLFPHATIILFLHSIIVPGSN